MKTKNPLFAWLNDSLTEFVRGVIKAFLPGSGIGLAVGHAPAALPPALVPYWHLIFAAVSNLAFAFHRVVVWEDANPFPGFFVDAPEMPAVPVSDAPKAPVSSAQ